MEEEKIYNIIYPDFQKIDNNIKKYNKELEKINKKYKILLKYNNIFNFNYKFDENNICYEKYSSNFLQIIIYLFTFVFLLFIKDFSCKKIGIPFILSLFCIAIFLYLSIVYVICKIIKKKFQKEIINYAKQLNNNYIIIIDDTIFTECDYIDNNNYKVLKRLYKNNIKKIKNGYLFKPVIENENDKSKIKYQWFIIESRINKNAKNKALKEYMNTHRIKNELIGFDLYQNLLDEFLKQWQDMKSINNLIHNNCLDLTNII